VSRKLYPKRGLLLGHIYSALGIPRSMFTVMFRHRPHRRFGWRSGRKWCPIPTCGSAGRASSTRVPPARLSDDRKALIDGGATLRDILRRPWRRCCSAAPQTVGVADAACPSAAVRRPQQCAMNGWGRGSRQHTLTHPSPRFAPATLAKLALNGPSATRAARNSVAHPRGRKTVRHQLHGPHLLGSMPKPAVLLDLRLRRGKPNSVTIRRNWRGQELPPCRGG